MNLNLFCSLHMTALRRHKTLETENARGTQHDAFEVSLKAFELVRFESGTMLAAYRHKPQVRFVFPQPPPGCFSDTIPVVSTYTYLLFLQSASRILYLTCSNITALDVLSQVAVLVVHSQSWATCCIKACTRATCS